MKYTYLMLLLILLAITPNILYAQFGGGNGSLLAPWQIATAYHLNNVRSYCGPAYRNKYFVQTANIDLYNETREGGTYWNNGEGWLPLGTFYGNYKGNGHTINGMYINRPGSDSQGLFSSTNSYVSPGNIVAETIPVISNLGLTNIDITARNHVGALAGYQFESRTSNCYSTGIIRAGSDVGGLIGIHTHTVGVYGNANAGIYDCWSSVDVMRGPGTDSIYLRGGLVGRNTGGMNIERSFSTGIVTGDTSIGGLVGYNGYHSLISNSYSTGNVSGNLSVGGLAGEIINVGDLTNCYSTGTVSGTAGYIGGLVGRKDEYSTVSNSYYDREVCGLNDTGKGIPRTTEEMTQQSLFSNWNFTSVWRIVEGFSYPYLQWQGNTPANHNFSMQGEGTIANPWQIAYAGQLNGLRYFLGQGHSNKYFIQTADINLGIAPWNVGSGWLPIGTDTNGFYGKFSGKRISGLTINRPEMSYVGLFGEIYGQGSVSNLGMFDVDIIGGAFVGAIAGSINTNSAIAKSFATGSVSGTSSVGGLVGTNINNSSVTDCYSHMEVTGRLSGETPAACIGGIAGLQAESVMSRCYATGLVTAIGLEPPNGYQAAVLGRSIVSTLTDIYWNSETTGQTHGVGTSSTFPGSTTEEMILAETYTGFDFVNIWSKDEGWSYPYLQWEGNEAGTHNILTPPPPPPAPQELGYFSYNGFVIIYWERPEGLSEEDIEGYNIYRNGVFLSQTNETAQYQDNNLTNWTNYAYSVTTLSRGQESVLSPAISAMPGFEGGNGTLNNPWQISSAGQLNGVSRYLGSAHNDKHFIQIADIDLGIAPWNGGQGWVPIGNSSANSFQGNYNGNGKIISKLTINRPNNGNQALFGFIGGNALIYDLGLKDVDVTGLIEVGTIVSNMNNDSGIERCFVTGKLTGMNTVGGISGSKGGGSYIQDCYTVVNITIAESHSPLQIGGICGIQTDGWIRRSYAVGWIIVQRAYPGALIGENYGNFSHLYWNNQTTGMDYGIGGGNEIQGNITAEMLLEETFAGFNFDTVWQIDENYTYPYLQWEETGIHNKPVPFGLSCETGDETIHLSWLEIPVFGVSGYNVYRNGVRINNEPIETHSYTDTNSMSVSYTVTALYGEIESLHSMPMKAITVSFAGGNGSLADPFLISTAENLDNVRYALSYHFKQTDDIELGAAPYNSDNGWRPIGDDINFFSGTYNGNGKNINGLTITYYDSFSALFGVIGGTARIYDLSMRNVNITTGTSSPFVGFMIGDSVLERVYASGNITGGSYIGGLVARLGGNAIIRDSYSAINISATWNNQYTIVGGILASQTGGVVSRCYATGSVSIAGTPPPTTRQGAVIGWFSSGSHSHLYWDNQTTGQLRAIGGSTAYPGFTSEQMKQEANFVGLNFNTVWQIDEGRSYPYFRWEWERNPVPAINPYPADGGFVRTGFQQLSWDYIINPDYAIPYGFKVFASQTENFTDNDFVWVPYIEDQVSYSCDLTIEIYSYFTDHYWKVVPTTLDPALNRTPFRNESDNSRGDAESVPVWTFSKALDEPELNIIFSQGNLMLIWDIVDGAVSYLIYATYTPYLPDSWTFIDATQFTYYFDFYPEAKKFYRVTATIENPER